MRSSATSQQLGAPDIPHVYTPALRDLALKYELKYIVDNGKYACDREIVRAALSSPLRLPSVADLAPLPALSSLTP